jgi:hypothetical protein
VSQGRLVTSTILTLTLAFITLYVPPASAANYTVGCPGNAPTLPAAVSAANLGLADTIILTPGCVYNVTSTLTFTDSDTTTIIGNGATIDAGGAVGVLRVVAAASVTLDRVNIMHGFAPVSGGGIANSGALKLLNSNVLFSTAPVGGGIRNFNGNVILINSNVVHCESTAPNGGGGIHTTYGQLLIQDSSNISHNVASSQGGGIANYNSQVTIDASRVSDNIAGGRGGGLMTIGAATTISGSIISDNRSPTGGGIFNDSHMVVQDDSLITDNQATGEGGGIWNALLLTLTDSSVSDNNAVQLGGGILNRAQVGLVNSRVSDNRSGSGAGVFNFGSSTTPTNYTQLTLDNSLIANNRADEDRGGGVFNMGGVVTARNSSISSNVAIGDGGGMFNISVPSQATADFTSSRLTDNRTTGPGSSGGGIYNQGKASFVSSTISENHAARGGGLFNDGQLDLKSSTLSDNDADAGGGLWNGSSATLRRSSSSNNVAARGGGIFNARQLLVDRSTVSDNRARSDGGGIFNDGTQSPPGAMLTLKDSVVSTNRADAGNGGGIFNIAGNVIISGTLDPELPSNASRISQNRALSGGGIFNTQGGSAILSRTRVSSNRTSVSGGGGILNTGNGFVSLERSVVSRNRASGEGGGVSNESGSAVNIRSTTISDNVVVGPGFPFGGAVFSSGNANIRTSTLSGNSALFGGGVLAVGPASFVSIMNSTLSDNTAEGAGGGVVAANAANVSVSWTTMIGNDNTGTPTTLDGGNLYNFSATLTVDHSIIASGLGTYVSVPSSQSNCFGPILGTNNLSNTAACGNALVVLSSLGLNTSPAVNGNPSFTKTHAISALSPARGLGTSCTQTDQRGTSRAPLTSCDVGSYEFP